MESTIHTKGRIFNNRSAKLGGAYRVDHLSNPKLCDHCAPEVPALDDAALQRDSFALNATNEITDQESITSCALDNDKSNRFDEQSVHSSSSLLRAEFPTTMKSTHPSTRSDSPQTEASVTSNSEPTTVSGTQHAPVLIEKKQYRGSPWLQRLFESSLFTMDMALKYLFESEDVEVKLYLANRLFSFSEVDVDFYLPQLASLYYQRSPDLAKYLYPYLLHRCKTSTEFATRLVWLFDTFDPTPRDPIRSNNCALNRPSSLPTFAQHVAPLTSSAVLSAQTSTGGSTPKPFSLPTNCESQSHQQSNGDELDCTLQPTPQYSVQSLRTILFPTHEYLSELLCRLQITTPNQISSHPGRHSISITRAVFEANPYNSSFVSHTLPPSGIPTKPIQSLTCGHKRAVSDVTSLTTSLSLRSGCRVQPNVHEQSVVPDASTDSAICLSKDTEWPVSHKEHRRHHSVVLCLHEKTPLHHGSLASVNKVITKEILPTLHSEPQLRNAHSLQLLHSGHTAKFTPVSPYYSGTNAITDGVALNGQPPPGSPDTGIQLTVAASRTTPTEPEEPISLDDRLSQTESADPILELQLKLIPRLLPEYDFLDGLLRLARRLVPISSKEQKTAFLQAELGNLNLHLPARVWLPVNQADHIILRIPPTAAVCLNSKDKAPYLIYVEVLSCDDPWSIALPSRRSGRPSSIPTGATSFTSLSNIAWNSHTPSSHSAASAVAAPDSISLMSASSNDSSSGEARLDSRLSGPICNGVSGKLTDSDGGGDISDKCGAMSAPEPPPRYIAAGEIRQRLKEQSEHQPHRAFTSDPDDPSAAVLKEPWYAKCQRIRESSPWGSLTGWRLTAAIIKVGDDLRQEQLAYQLISVLQRIWAAEHVPLWVRPLTVIVTSTDSGLIEPVPDTVSLHQIRRHARLSLLHYLLREHGPVTSESFLTAQHNFVQSCAAYCLIGYLLQVKDRHNGNILLDNQGHMIHIDYGFLLSASPGKNLGFENSPFKLTAEQVDVMGGVGSDMFEYYKLLLLRGLLAARKHMEQICVLVEIARATCPQLPCFSRGAGTAAIAGLRQRFKLASTEDQLRQSVDRMVEVSLHSVRTKLYDSFQYYTNGIQY